MTIEKRTVLSQIEITASGIVQVRLDKQIVEDGAVIASQWHRTSFEPGDDVDAQMARVNAHLVQMGCAACEDYEDVKAHAAIAHTPARIAAFEAARASAASSGSA